eukprot:8094449-Pyramimonas_sp.AAC.1
MNRRNSISNDRGRDRFKVERSTRWKNVLNDRRGVKNVCARTDVARTYLNWGVGKGALVCAKGAPWTRKDHA